MPLNVKAPPTGVTRDPSGRFGVEVTVDEKDHAVWLSSGNMQVKVGIPSDNTAEFTADIGAEKVSIALADGVVRINGDVVKPETAAEKFGASTQQQLFINAGTGKGIGAIGLRFADVTAEQSKAVAALVTEALDAFVTEDASRLDYGEIFTLNGTLGSGPAQIFVEKKDDKVGVTIWAEKLGTRTLPVESPAALERVKALFAGAVTDAWDGKYAKDALALLG